MDDAGVLVRFRVTDKDSGAVLAERAERASALRWRFLGLMGKASLPVGEGLHLIPCNSIHTLFMRFPIDVLFLSQENVVVRALPQVPPWRAARVHRLATSVLELPAGTLAGAKTQVGHQIWFENLD